MLRIRKGEKSNGKVDDKKVSNKVFTRPKISWWGARWFNVPHAIVKGLESVSIHAAGTTRDIMYTFLPSRRYP